MNNQELKTTCPYLIEVTPMPEGVMTEEVLGRSRYFQTLLEAEAFRLSMELDAAKHPANYEDGVTFEVVENYHFEG